MARKTNDNGAGCILVFPYIFLIVIAIFYSILSVAAPVYFLIMTIIGIPSIIKINKYSDLEIGLNEYEIEKYCDCLDNYNAARIAEATVVVHAEDQGLSRNVDGSFSNRSNKGKEINKELAGLWDEKEYYSNSIQKYEYLPESRWIEYNAVLTKAINFTSGLLAILVWYWLFQINKDSLVPLNPKGLIAYAKPSLQYSFYALAVYFSTKISMHLMFWNRLPDGKPDISNDYHFVKTRPFYGKALFAVIATITVIAFECLKN